MKKFKEIFKKYHLFYVCLIAAYYLSKLLVYNNSASLDIEVHVITMKIDELIPFCKYFIIFYFTYYWFLPLLLYIMSYVNKRKFYRMLISAASCAVIANIIFMLYQVKMVRPEIVGNDIFDIWVRWLYSMDPTALNCFPSIHSVVGTMMVIGGLNNDKVLFPKWLSVLSVIFGVGCALSTVFIKQHYFIDMVVGAIIAIVVYTIVFLIDKKICKKKN